MSKKILTSSTAALIVAGALSFAAPAAAQLGGVTGSVTGSVDSTLDTGVRSSTDIRANTRVNTRLPETGSSTKVWTSSPVIVTYGTTRSGGYHSHGHYNRHTHTHGYDHFYDNHTHSHGHGHGHARYEVHIHGESDRAKDDKDNVEKTTEARTSFSKEELLTYGTLVRSSGGVDLGTITSLQRMSDGEIVGVGVGGETTIIPVGALYVDGGVLVHVLANAETAE